MAEQDVLRLEAGERAPRREEAQERVDAERLAGRAGSSRGCRARPRRRGSAPRRTRARPPARSACRTIGKATNGAPSTSVNGVTWSGTPRRSATAAQSRLWRSSSWTTPRARPSARDPLVDALAVDDVRQPDARLRRGSRETCARSRSPSMLQPKPCSNSSSKRSGTGKLWRVALTNAEIADRLESLAALLDLTGSSPYAPRAYRRAAETIRETPAPIPELVRTRAGARAARDRARDRGAAAGARRDGADRGAGRAGGRGLAGARRARAVARVRPAAGARSGARSECGPSRSSARPLRRDGCGRCPGSGRRRRRSCSPRSRAESGLGPGAGCCLNRAARPERGHRRGARRRGRGRPAALAGRERGVRGRRAPLEARAGAGAVRAAAADRLDRRAGEAAGDRRHGRGRSGRARRRGAAALRDRARAGDRVGASTSRRWSRCRTRRTRRACTGARDSRSVRPSFARRRFAGEPPELV